MKSLATKLLAIVFIFALATGCASSITAPQQDIQKEKTVKKQNNPNPGDITAGADPNESVERPDF